jgi:hypothetical protein
MVYAYVTVPGCDQYKLINHLINLTLLYPLAIKYYEPSPAMRICLLRWIAVYNICGQDVISLIVC